MSAQLVLAAGALCWRVIDQKIHILFVHRTQYADVTIPKGKLDPGETLAQTAVREIKEETGLDITLGLPLGNISYSLSKGRQKVVTYWAAHVSEEALKACSFVPNNEIAALEWAPLKKAHKHLSYEQDVKILDRFTAWVDKGVTETFSITILRHAKARSFRSPGEDDALRPLSEQGLQQAHALIPELAARGIQKIITSDALRCVTTVSAFSASCNLIPKRTSTLSQNAYESGASSLQEFIAKRIRSRKNILLCTHAPVVYELIRHIELATGGAPCVAARNGAPLSPAQKIVLHLSKTHPASEILAVEAPDNQN